MNGLLAFKTFSAQKFATVMRSKITRRVGHATRTRFEIRKTLYSQAKRNRKCRLRWRIILKWTLSKLGEHWMQLDQDTVQWGHFWGRQWTLGFLKRWDISWLGERLSAPEEGLRLWSIRFRSLQARVVLIAVSNLNDLCWSPNRQIIWYILFKNT
jgi:hypothetical protein